MDCESRLQVQVKVAGLGKEAVQEIKVGCTVQYVQYRTSLMD